MGIEGAHGVAQLQRFVVHPQQAVAQLHHGDVEGRADGRQFIAPLHRHLQAEIAVAQGLGQHGDAAGAAPDRRLQAHKKIQRSQQQAAQHCRYQGELANRRAVVVVQPRIQCHQ